MRQRNTCKLKPVGREDNIQILGHAIERIPEDSMFMMTLRTNRKLGREIAAQIVESRRQFGDLHPDDVRPMDITPQQFEAAGFSRAAEMVRLMGLKAI